MAKRGKHKRKARGAVERPGERAVFLERVARIFDVPPAEAERLAIGERRASLRLNRLSPLPPEDVLAALADLGAELEPLPWCPDAYVLLSDKQAVSASALFREGHVYIQNAASLIPPLALDPQPGEAVLDLCAAPGGKAAHIAALTGGACELWVNDASKPRVAKMHGILAALGVRPARVLQHEAQYIDKFVQRRFQRILLDAQCSGDGMLDLGHPNALRYWSLARVRRYGYLQQRMLRAAFRLLEPGGVLVYSTCAFAPEENEAPLSHLLAHTPEADVEAIGLDIAEARPGLTRWQGTAYDPRLARALRIRPSTVLEGFFVCRLVRRSPA